MRSAFDVLLTVVFGAASVGVQPWLARKTNKSRSSLFPIHWLVFATVLNAVMGVALGWLLLMQHAPTAMAVAGGIVWFGICYAIYFVWQRKH